MDKLLSLAWTIAEVEARALGSAVIETEHFLLSALMIVVGDVEVSEKSWREYARPNRMHD